MGTKIQKRAQIKFESANRAPNTTATTTRHNANLRQDADGQDHHAGGRGERLDRERQGQDPGQGGHPAGPAAADLCGQAAGGRAHAQRLQHPEGEHAAPGAAPARRFIANVDDPHFTADDRHVDLIVDPAYLLILL